MSTSTLAIFGGSPEIKTSHAKANQWPQLSSEDENAVLDVIRSGNISTNPIIRTLEEKYKEFTGAPYALAHNNGTSALLAAFYGIGLKNGDEVLVPSATFWASILPMLWVGAVPVFCDSESERLGIDPVDMEKKITSKTKAIVVVHLWGLPSKMTEIYALAKKYNLKIIEDASHAHGATWNGKACGTLGDISVLSLQGDKLAPAGEGGMLLCKDYETYERVTCLGDITRIIELETPARRFAATSFGIKTRIAPLSAAIGIQQLSRLQKNNTIRSANIERLSVILEELGFHTYQAPEHIHRVYFEFLIKINPDKIKIPIDLLMKALQAEGCEVSAPRYPLVHQQPFFSEGHFKDVLRLPEDCPLPDYNEVSLPFIEQENQNLLKLPSFPNEDSELIEQYTNAFRKVLLNSDELLKKQDTL